MKSERLMFVDAHGALRPCIINEKLYGGHWTVRDAETAKLASVNPCYALRILDPIVGRTYRVPSGLGGSFRARLLHLGETHGQFRVIAPNSDWHDYLVTVSRNEIMPDDLKAL